MSWPASIRKPIEPIVLRTYPPNKTDEAHRPMPLIIGLILVALSIWFAEDLATSARAWSYPNQEASWHMVSLAKLGSWYLLMLISFVLVAALHAPER